MKRLTHLIFLVTAVAVTQLAISPLAAAADAPMVRDVFACTFNDGKDMGDLMAARDFYLKQMEKAGQEPAMAFVWTPIKANVAVDFFWANNNENLMDYARQNSPGWDESEVGAWAESKRQLDPIIATGIASEHPDWRETARSIVCPTLLVTADPEKGAIVTAEIAAEAQSLNDHIQVANVTGVGHSIRREDFGTYMDAVRSFLQQTVGS